MRYYFLLFFSIALLAGCEKYQHPTVPNVAVDFTIYPNDPNYAALNHFGGHMYFTGGFRGIVVYRLDQYTFKAYDRACPYDWEDPDSWIWVEESGLTLIDECCGSQFNIIDGTVVNPPASHALKYYRTNFDGMRLRIYN